MLIGLLFPLVGCDNATTRPGPQPQAGLHVIQMKLGSHQFDLEVADTEKSREVGLMYRESMPEDHGMIFIFDEAMERDFYMKNTRFPLDIAFLDAGGTVVSVKQMQPFDLRTTGSDKPAKYAIEMNAGESEKIGLKPGDKVDLGPINTNPAAK